MTEHILNIDPSILTEKLLNFGTSLLEAIAILVIGLWLSKMICRSVAILMQKRDIEHTTRNFLISFIRIILNTLVIIIAISSIGIKVTSILAVIGGSAVGIGLGLQGSFSNFAGGIMIIITRPFKTGDLIQTEEHIGYVENIHLLNTVIRSPRNELIILPNAPLFNTPLSNYSAKDAYRIDITVGVAYRSDIQKLRPLLKEAIGRSEMFMSDKRLTVEIEQFTHDRIHLTVRAYTAPTNYFDAPLVLHDICKNVIEDNGFVIPVNPQEIKIVKGE
ncbi:mechanosensitive ion channel family protein [Sinomicrobium sp.]